MSGLGEADLEQLRRVEAFQDLPSAALRQMARLTTIVEFGPGHRILRQSETTDFALALLSGVVAVVSESPRGDSRLAELAAPILVGEVAALGRVPRTASLVAETPVRALRIRRELLLEVCRHRPEIPQSVIAQLGGHIQSVNHALALFSDGFAALERDDFDPAILEDLSNPTPEVRALAAGFRRLADRISSERRGREEMASAALIQRAMLPPGIGAGELGSRADVNADMRPARRVGGDFYDLFRLDDRRLAVAIGDVCGKGVPASLFMSVTVTTLRLAAREWTSLSSMLETANDLLCAQNPTLMFSTLFFAILDLETGEVEYANCGHNPPLIVRRNGASQPLGSGGAPLGLVPGRAIASARFRLDPGETLFLFTDGVTESVDLRGETYGETRLAETLATTRGDFAANIVDAVMADVERFVGGAEPFDDVTCLALVRL